MVREPVPQPIRNRSGIGRAADISRIAASVTTPMCWGARGSLRVRFVPPGPMCAEGCPLACARVLPFPVAPARFRAWGQGHAPAPHLAALDREFPPGPVAITIASAIQGGPDADDRGASQQRRIHISFPPYTMEDLIQNLVHEHGATDSSIADELLQDGYIDDKTPVHTIIRERFRIRVFRGVKDDDDAKPAQHWVVFEFLAGVQWRTCLTLEERNLQHVFSGLNKLFDFLELEDPGSEDALSKIARRLPAVTLFGDRWYVDEKFRQLRKVDAPDEVINLD